MSRCLRLSSRYISHQAMKAPADTTTIMIVASALTWGLRPRLAEEKITIGKVVELGTTEQVLEAPQHPYTKALLSVVPEKHRVEPQILAGEIPDPSAIPEGCRFHPRCPLLLSGRASELGVSERCTTVAVELVDQGAGHLAACHALSATP